MKFARHFNLNGKLDLIVVKLPAAILLSVLPSSDIVQFNFFTKILSSLQSVSAVSLLCFTFTLATETCKYVKCILIEQNCEIEREKTHIHFDGCVQLLRFKIDERIFECADSATTSCAYRMMLQNIEIESAV